MVLCAGLLLLAGGALAWLGGEGPKVRENLYVPFMVVWSSGELLRERRPRLARVLYGVGCVLLVVHVALHVPAALGGLREGGEPHWWDLGLLGLPASVLVAVAVSVASRWWRRRGLGGGAPTA
ncbi:hypothetical protein [Streptomyces sp. CC210A]|uniref:hypothetical protein n=1 Tax=Streptomyces sp. CC210A TaxID=2898184 RepID=UPI001F3305F5|nr:hypothetical protein [Streptomyces sp. CC210A]